MGTKVTYKLYIKCKALTLENNIWIEKCEEKPAKQMMPSM